MNLQLSKDSKRIVIKIGTNSIMKSIDKINYHKIDRLAYVCSTLRQQGHDIILVASGAVGAGAYTVWIHILKFAEKQALASVGQRC